MLWWQACRLRVLRIAADTAASTEVVDSTCWGQLSHLVYKKPADSLEHLIEFVCGHLSDRVKNEVLFDAEKALRANEARLIDLAALTIAAIERNGESIPVCAAGDLAKNQICAGKISNR